MAIKEEKLSFLKGALKQFKNAVLIEVKYCREKVVESKCPIIKSR